jgi:DNA-binding transcriptional ArsR family regulator
MNYWTISQVYVINFVMKPLFHPAAKDITVEGILYAFSDPVRVQIFAALQKAEEAKSCSDFMNCDNQTLPKSTLSQHFKILRESGLIRSERKGVEMRNHTRCMDLKERFGPLVRSILDAYIDQNGKSKFKSAKKN